jgi:pimeloyl-ACP methyl ester carboxylesterase
MKSSAMKKIAIRVLRNLAILYLSACTFLYFFQESIIFVPSKLLADHVFTPPGVEEVSIEVKGATLSALHFKNTDPEGIILFLHGNAGNLHSWLPSTSFYEKVNYDLFMIDYRGYGKSTGSIKSEEEVKEDVLMAWNSIAGEYEGKTRVVYGRSLGGALASYVSAEVNPDITVLVSPFYSMRDMAELYYPWVPSFILRYELDTAQYLSKIKNQVYLFHGTKDDIIPLSQSKKLLGVSDKISFYEISGASHNDIHAFSEYERILEAILTK